MSETALVFPSDSHLPDIIQRYSNGEPIESIAGDYRVTRFTIYNWLLSELGDEQYREIKQRCHIRQICDADEKLEQAPDMLSFNKAHARAKLTRLDYERRFPLVYGPKQHVQQDTSITVTVNRWKDKTIDVTPQDSETGPRPLSAGGGGT